MTEQQTIELDCAPGFPRPWDLIGEVIKDTVLDTPDFEPRVTAVFGAASWSFDVPRDVWEADVQPVIKPRIEALYESGQIRYGSW